MERDLSDRVIGRLSELRTEYGLPVGSEKQLASILGSLAWEHAPTAVREPEDAVDVHVADALSGLSVASIKTADAIADIGSGCGIPGLVLAVALPQASLIAVEASERRCEFIRQSAELAGLGNVTIVCSRAEEWLDGIGKVDVVAARALAGTAVLLEYAAPLLRIGGELVAWKGTPESDELEAAATAATALGMSRPELISVEPWSGGGVRQLLRSVKESPTPERFPRRAGIAAKRPLGA